MPQHIQIQCNDSEDCDPAGTSIHSRFQNALPSALIIGKRMELSHDGARRVPQNARIATGQSMTSAAHSAQSTNTIHHYSFEQIQYMHD